MERDFQTLVDSQNEPQKKLKLKTFTEDRGDTTTKNKIDNKNCDYDKQNQQQVVLTQLNLNKCISRCKELFPVPPTEIQLNSCKKIIESLIINENLMLQYPSGQGKSIVLLCSALSVQEQLAEIHIIIMTTSQDHIQQLMKNLFLIYSKLIEKKSENKYISTCDRIADKLKEVQKYKYIMTQQSSEINDKKIDTNQQAIKIKENFVIQATEGISFINQQQMKKGMQEVKEVYQNKQIIFIFDEAHNIIDLARFSNKNKTIECYKSLHDEFIEMIQFSCYNKEIQAHAFEEFSEALTKNIQSEAENINKQIKQQINQKYQKDFKQEQNNQSVLCVEQIFLNQISGLSRFNAGQRKCTLMNIDSQQLRNTLGNLDKILTQKECVNQNDDQLIQRKIIYQKYIEALIQNYKELREQQINHYLRHLNNHIELVDNLMNNQCNMSKQGLPFRIIENDVLDLQECEYTLKLLIKILKTDKQTKERSTQLIQKLKFFSDVFKLFSEFCKDYIENVQQQKEMPQCMFSPYFQQTMDKRVFNIEFGRLSSKSIIQNIKTNLSVRSFVFTSCTLSSFNNKQMEDYIGFPMKYFQQIGEVTHKVYTYFMSTHQGKLLGSSYLTPAYQDQNDSENQQMTIKHTSSALEYVIRTFISSTEKNNRKAGMLVFFKSYDSLNECYQQFRLEYPILIDIILIQQKQNQQQNLESYRREIQTQQKNQIYFCVQRGSVSEGIEFPDDYCRAVVEVGIPYPITKLLHSQASKIQVNEFFTRRAAQLINCAAGRCIQHEKDWGSVILIDQPRNLFKEVLDFISPWIKEGAVTEEIKFNNSYTKFLDQRFQEDFNRNSS